MAKYNIVFDGDDESFQFLKNGRPIENLEGVFLSCFRDFDGGIHYHLSYEQKQDGERVHRSTDFNKEKDDSSSPLNAEIERAEGFEGTEERVISEGPSRDFQRVVKNFLAAESVFGGHKEKKKAKDEKGKNKGE